MHSCMILSCYVVLKVLSCLDLFKVCLLDFVLCSACSRGHLEIWSTLSLCPLNVVEPLGRYNLHSGFIAEMFCTWWSLSAGRYGLGRDVAHPGQGVAQLSQVSSSLADVLLSCCLSFDLSRCHFLPMCVTPACCVHFVWDLSYQSITFLSWTNPLAPRVRADC